MTVKELREELKNYPDDMLIIADGTDFGLRVYHEEWFYQK